MNYVFITIDLTFDYDIFLYIDNLNFYDILNNKN